MTRNVLSLKTDSTGDGRKHRLMSLASLPREKKKKKKYLKLITKSKNHGKVQHLFCKGKAKLGSSCQVPLVSASPQPTAAHTQLQRDGHGGAPAALLVPPPHWGPPRPHTRAGASTRGPSRSPPGPGSRTPPAVPQRGGRLTKWRAGGRRRYLSALTGGLRSRITATAAAPLAYCAMPAAWHCRASPRLPGRSRGRASSGGGPWSCRLP